MQKKKEKINDKTSFINDKENTKNEYEINDKENEDKNNMKLPF
jgi:hypothetical protein